MIDLFFGIPRMILKAFVTVLERINAVGMSVQIIETIKDSHLQLTEETKAEFSKKLIDLYTDKK